MKKKLCFGIFRIHENGLNIKNQILENRVYTCIWISYFEVIPSKTCKNVRIERYFKYLTVSNCQMYSSNRLLISVSFDYRKIQTENYIDLSYLHIFMLFTDYPLSMCQRTKWFFRQQIQFENYFNDIVTPSKQFFVFPAIQRIY